jgi:ketosteroid isomerase-like protein
MSVRNVELHRRAFSAINARDVKAVVALSDPQVEAISIATVPGGAVYRGHTGLRRYLRDIDEAWEAWRVEPEAFFDLGAETLAFYVYRGRGRRSGAEVALPTAQLARWRDGLLVYLKSYASREEALAELRLSEDELEPIAP